MLPPRRRCTVATLKPMNTFQRGDAEFGGIVIALIGILAGWGIVSLFDFNYHGTNEGTVNYSDCRQVVTLQPNDWRTYFGTFVGTELKTKSGTSLGGEFVKTETQSGLCTKAYVYYKQR